MIANDGERNGPLTTTRSDDDDDGDSVLPFQSVNKVVYDNYI